ncbi:hypothetical protein DFP73DRAFT_636146 [Morchella snyderi]|nr:hypothetical protein DFP73DRAFT_636146 [Morchella snyderi]
MLEAIAAVGLVASIAGILQLTGMAITQGCIYIGDMETLKTQLDGFQATNNHPRLLALELLDIPGGPLQSCKDIVDIVRDIIENLNGRLSHRNFLHPLRARNIEQCTERLERLKSVLQLALYADQMALSNEVEKYIRTVHEGLKDINHDVKEILSEVKHIKQLSLNNDVVRKEKKRVEILHFLSKIDHASNHHTARELHRSGTCKWFIDGKDLEQWQNLPGSVLWLHGILGSGKTILTSTIIEHISTSIKLRTIPGPNCSCRYPCPPTGHSILHHHCTRDSAIIYFYFDFKDTEKQTTIGMLGSLVYQLLEKLPEMPQEVETFFKVHQPNMSEDTKRSSGSDIDKLWSLFTMIVSIYFGRVFVILDALDECIERSTLLLTLDRMVRQENLQCPCNFLFTSRKEYEIEKMFLKHPVHTVCIESGDVVGDVKLFIAKNIEEDGGLKDLKPELKDRIISTLAQQAKGMFRLAKYQFDIIRELRRPKTILEALKTLPQDLNETYERILLGIKSEDDIKLMRRVLKLIIFAVRPMTIEEVAEASVIEEGIESLDEDARLNDPSSLLKISGGILSLTGRFIGLAHYSIQQYITSESTRQGRASHFFIAEAEAQVEISKICLTYLGFEDFDIPVADIRIINRFEHFPFYRYAAENWFRHAKGKSIDESLTMLATKAFVSYKTPKFRSWLRAYILQEIKVFPRGNIVSKHDILQFLPHFEIPPFPRYVPDTDFIKWLSYDTYNDPQQQQQSYQQYDSLHLWRRHRSK